MRRRLLFGPARFYVATLVVVLAAVGLFAVAKGQEQPAASPIPTLAPGAVSPLDEALQGIRDDGTWSKETALAVFAASFGPIPGVPAPPADPSYRSGSLAIRMVEAYWSELTDAQKQAIKGYIGPTAASAVQVGYRPKLAVLFDTYQQITDQAVADVAAAFGRPLGIPYKVVFSDKENADSAWAWATADWTGLPPGSLAPDCTMTFPPSTVADPSRVPYLRWLVLHEVWHCFAYSMIDFVTYKSSPAWVLEGSASWVAEAITGGAGAPPPELDHWSDYIFKPGTPLYTRAYDAVGFYAQLAQFGIDPWKVIGPMAKAGGSDAAFQASGANNPNFMDRYGSSWFRDAKPDNFWAMYAGFGIPPASTSAVPAPIAITDGARETMSAKPLGAAIGAVDTTAFVTRFEVSGVGRVADPANAALDRIVRTGKLDLCTNPAGDCTCPPGSVKTPASAERAPGKLRAEASGEQHNISVMDIQGISKDDWCGATATPAPEAGNLCKAGCAGSNGDPHMRTVDKAQYDLQSVGEYVLLRSADGTFEIQGRQERPTTGGNATVNTAVAVKINGHRVAFYNTNVEGPAAVRIDGASVDAASSDLGPGATLISLPRGYELDVADGSRVWVLAAGKASISITVIPSDALRASAVGLLARVPSNAGLRVPGTSDGKTFPVPLTPQERYHDIYDILAPSWRVTAKATLFDYDAGKSTDSYTLAGFPPVTVPETLDQLDPAAVASAKTSCAGVVDPDLATQCTYDVAVTGTIEFVTLYTMSDDLQADGPASMSLPTPGSTPSPSPSGALGQATGVNLVADHLAGVASATVGPDGTVYMEVGEAGQGLFDFTRVLLAVDPATGKVRQRAVAKGYGLLAWADGSLWAGEFNQGDSGCEVSRLDPVTLAVQATVTTVCSAGSTDFAAVGAAIWFVDPTGADAAGNGGHFKRVDPATNKVDTSPAGTIDLPFVSPVLHVAGAGAIFRSTSQGLILGDHQHGTYFLAAGGGAFNKLTLPADASVLRTVAGGAGVWVQTQVGTSSAPEGAATFASADSPSGAQVGINGDLVGADDAALYADQSDDDSLPDELWRYPIDRSVPAKLVVSGFVPNGFGGQMRLLYRDPGFPLLVGPGEVVKIWQVASPTTPDQVAVMLQAAPIP